MWCVTSLGRMETSALVLQPSTAPLAWGAVLGPWLQYSILRPRLQGQGAPTLRLVYTGWACGRWGLCGLTAERERISESVPRTTLRRPTERAIQFVV
jgi:hypothetical protein